MGEEIDLVGRGYWYEVDAWEGDGSYYPRGDLAGQPHRYGTIEEAGDARRASMDRVVKVTREVVEPGCKEIMIFDPDNRLVWADPLRSPRVERGDQYRWCGVPATLQPNGNYEARLPMPLAYYVEQGFFATSAD